MSWAKLDDQFFAHPKVVNLSQGAKLLYLAAVAYSAAQLTDGVVPPGAMKILAPQAGVIKRRLESTIGELVEAHLWELLDANRAQKMQGLDINRAQNVHAKCYLIHDYLKYNPSAEKVKAEREKTAQRVAAWREGQDKNEKCNGVTNAVTEMPRNGVSNAPPVPVPSSVLSASDISGEVNYNVVVVEKAAAAVWNDRTLSQTAERIRATLRLPSAALPNLKTTLAQYPCAPPYLEGEAASCAEYYANEAHKKASLTGFNRWMKRSERERLAGLESSNHHDQSTQQQQATVKPKSDADILYEYHRAKHSA